MASDLATAVAAYTAGVDALLAADVEAASHRELLTAYADIETAARRTPVVGYGILARLEREADPKSLGATSPSTAPRLTTPSPTGNTTGRPTSTTWPWRADQTTA